MPSVRSWSYPRGRNGRQKGAPCRATSYAEKKQKVFDLPWVNAELLQSQLSFSGSLVAFPWVGQPR